MKTINFIKKSFKSRLKLLRGTRFISFLFIGTSILIGAGMLWAASVYYNIDTAEVVMEEVQRVTGVLRATAGVIVGGTASQDPSAGYGFEVVGQTKLATTTVAAGTLELTAANQVLKFTGGVSGYYAEFKANTSATSGQAITYTLPAAKPDVTNYVLTSGTDGTMTWQSVSGVGAGDINAVGNVSSGAAFTGDDAGGSPGNTLLFEGATANDYEIALTAADPGVDYTITLPAANGYIALGSSTANYVAYWTGANTLNGEQYLNTSRGGIGESSADWNGMVNIVSGNWGTTTGTQNYAAYWSDANTVAAEANLNVIRGGTGAGTFTQYGIIYGNSTSAFGVTAAGTADYLLVGAGAGSPTWKYINQILNAGTNISLSGTSTIATVNNPSFSVSVTSPQFLSTTTLAIQSGDSQNITINSASGKIVLASGDWIETNLGYEIGKSGTQVLIEMIPIMGFDLPAQTATTSYVTISRTIENYPFSATTTGGTTRIHKFVIRYVDDLPTASSSDWRVYNVTDTATTSTFTMEGCNDATLSKGKTQIKETTIPTDGDDFRLDVKIPSTQSGKIIRVFQVFLAAYDQIQ
jgi:hypothetical protein